MIKGPNYVYECPNCGSHLTRESFVSGSTFGAKIFSDGKQIAPLLPELPNLIKCKKCNAFFWLSKLKKTGTYNVGDNVNSKWENAQKIDFLEIDDYFIAIHKGIAENKDEESYIRQQIWWAYNDRIRASQEIFSEENDELRWIENLKKLKELIDDSDIYQKILIAEIDRNLGDFESCISIIQSIDNDEVSWLKEKLLNECKQKNKWVIELD